jgi:hypothetical protein
MDLKNVCGDDGGDDVHKSEMEDVKWEKADINGHFEGLDPECVVPVEQPNDLEFEGIHIDVSNPEGTQVEEYYDPGSNLQLATDLSTSQPPSTSTIPAVSISVIPQIVHITDLNQLEEYQMNFECPQWCDIAWQMCMAMVSDPEFPKALLECKPLSHDVVTRLRARTGSADDLEV